MRSDLVPITYSLNTILNKLSIEVQIDLQDPVKSRVSGKITLCLKVAAAVTFSAGPVSGLDLQSLYSIRQMTKIVESLSGEGSNKLSPVWLRFIKSLDTVASNAQKIGEVRKYLSPRLNSQVYMNDNSSIHQSRSPWER